MVEICRDRVQQQHRPAPSGFATSLNLDTLLQASNSATASPDSKTADQIHFAVNNLSGENVKLKGQEVKGKLKPEFYEWFATYMVVKRAAIEPNFHSLYLEMLDEIGEEKLFEEILRATYHNVKVLLTSGKVKTNSGERSLLKNLGSWLGGLTIARLQPVLMIDLDVKGLILDAYEAGRMIAVIPFVAKILDPAIDTFVFKPPNPWTAAILALVAEIYLDRALKLHLKFETERLFKHFNLSVKDVKPSNLLQNRQRVHIDNPDFVADKVPAGLNGIAPGGMLQTASSDGQLPSLQGQQRGGMGVAGVSSFLNKTCSNNNSNSNASRTWQQSNHRYRMRKLCRTFKRMLACTRNRTFRRVFARCSFDFCQSLRRTAFERLFRRLLNDPLLLHA